MADDSDSVEFSWRDDDSVVIERVDALAVYSNPSGNIVIRQQDAMGGDDAIIVIPRSRLKDLVLALQNELDGEPT
jgi:hypothetical protein